MQPTGFRIEVVSWRQTPQGWARGVSYAPDFSPFTPVNQLQETARALGALLLGFTGPMVIATIFARGYEWRNPPQGAPVLQESLKEAGHAWFMARGSAPIENWQGWQ
jgi:hypothetical protein